MQTKSSKVILTLLLVISIFGCSIRPVTIISLNGVDTPHEVQNSNRSMGSSPISITENSTSHPKNLQYFNLSHHGRTMFPSEIQGIQTITTGTGPAGIRVYDGTIDTFGAVSWDYTVKTPSGGYEQIEAVTAGDINNDGEDEVILLSQAGLLYALSSNGILLWRTVTGLAQYDLITILDATETSGLEIILYDEDESSFWIYSNAGYPVDKVTISGDGILTMDTGQINETISGNELLLVNHSGGIPDLTVLNNWNLRTKSVFRIDLDWFPSTTAISTKLLAEDLATEAGEEIAVAVKRNGYSRFMLGVYNSTGGDTNRWGNPQAYNFSTGTLLQFTSTQIEGTTRLVLTTPDYALIAKNATMDIQIPVLNLIDTAIVNATATAQPDLATVYHNYTSGQIESSCLNLTKEVNNTVWKRNISVGVEATYFDAAGDTIYIASESGSYSSLSKDGQIINYGAIPAGVLTKHSTIQEKALYEVSSSRQVLALDRDSVQVVSASPSERGAFITKYKIGDYDPDETGLETVLVEKTFTGRQLSFFDQDGNTLTTASLHPNLSVEVLGTPYPGAKKLPVGMQNLTSNRYYAAVCDVDTGNITLGRELYGAPQQIVHAILRNKNTFIYYTLSENMLHVMDSNAEYIGFKSLPGTLDQIVAVNLDGEGGDEIIYTHGGNKLTILREDLSEITTVNFDYSTNHFVVGDLISYLNGNEIVTTDGPFLVLLNQTGRLGDMYVGFSGQVATFVEPVNVSGDITFLVASNSQCGIVRMWEEGTSIDVKVDSTISIPGLSAIPLLHAPKNSSTIGTFTFSNATGTWMPTLTVQKDFYHPTIITSSPSIKTLNATNITFTWKNNFSLFTQIKDDASIKSYGYTIRYYDEDGDQVSSDQASYTFQGKKPTSNHTLSVTVTNQIVKLKIALLTEDWVGRMADERMLIHVDREAPSLQLQTPSSIQASGEEVSVTTLVRDNIQLKTVYLRVQGNTILMTANPPRPISNKTKTYRYTAEITTNLLNVGSNTVTIFAEDEAGHSTSIEMTIEKPGIPPLLLWGTIGGVCVAVIGLGVYLYRKKYRSRET